MSLSPATLGHAPGPWENVRSCLVLAPHPDDFDVVAVTLRHLEKAGALLSLEVLTSGASGVEDCFAEGWEQKMLAREAEQHASCRLFGLPKDRIRFHRLKEDETGHMLDDDENENRVRKILERSVADAVVLPHGSDSNADHRRTFRMFDRWAREQSHPLLALLVRDPKTLGMRLDLLAPFEDEEAAWKAEILRCHASQHERNLRARGHGIDQRILQVNREIAQEAGMEHPFAEGFELVTYNDVL